MASRTGIWSVYILECQDGSYYIGISTNPEKRFELHKTGKGAAYTRSHPPRRLLTVEVVGSYSEALRKERQMKRLSKAAKNRYIQTLAATQG